MIWGSFLLSVLLIKSTCLSLCISYVRRFYASQVLLGLQYLHSQGVIYRLVDPSLRSLYLCYLCNCVASDILLKKSCNVYTVAVDATL